MKIPGCMPSRSVGARIMYSSLFSRLWTGQARVQFLPGARDFSVLQNVETGSWAPLDCHWGGVAQVKWLRLEVDCLTPIKC